MTVERRLVVGLEDIKAIVLECGKCKARYSLKPESGDIPTMCHCREQWLFGPHTAPTPLEQAVSAIALIRRHLAESKGRPLAPYTLSFEFEEPEA